MLAVRVSGPGDVELVNVPRPEPDDAEVLVRLEVAAICATDRRGAARGLGRPRILGHEGAGRLEDGTPVGIHPNIGCGRCEHCAAGLENRCPLHQDMGRDRDGLLAEWVAVPDRHAVPLDGLGFEHAPLVEPLACVLHAVSLLGVHPGDRTLVVGAGSLGVLATWVLQAGGASVAVLQRSEPRRALARALGADVALAPGDDAVHALGGPIAAALVAAPGDEALRAALDAVAEGGAVHAFAGTPGGAPVDANIVHYRQLRLIGSTGSTLDDYRRALAMASNGTVPIDRLPRTVVPLDRVPQVLLDPLADPRTLKIAVRIQ
jgi:L-iditol 2-dehydrogenase